MIPDEGSNGEEWSILSAGNHSSGMTRARFSYPGVRWVRNLQLGCLSSSEASGFVSGVMSSANENSRSQTRPVGQISASSTSTAAQLFTGWMYNALIFQLDDPLFSSPPACCSSTP